ncbi:putative ARC18-subunit of the Arp2/3 complex [Paraphysoderma sedebokerense]|nr:putative ARC18-subunit of the Arp2/3 complex [Paraphysoderma sedebokerense]
MPVYHSSFNEIDARQLGNMAFLPIKTKIRGPAPNADPNSDDIVDEALTLFRANCFFRNFEIKGPADRTLIYLILFISDCLTKITAKSPAPNQAEGLKMLTTLAMTNFSIPGDGQFPLNALYSAPAVRTDADLMRQYISQLRQETVNRLVERIYADGKLSKWWTCFAKRKFMGKSL